MSRPFRVDGAAKVGVVRLSFVDMSIDMLGIPIEIVRTYDSRVKTNEDFGYGWTLDVRSGSAQHNRPIGLGYAIYTSSEPFALPCQQEFEQQTHFTEIRLTEREWYYFRPVLANVEAVSGSCHADVFFELVDSYGPWAELRIVGPTRVRSTAHAPTSDPATLAPSFLTHVETGELFDPQQMQLLTADGHLYDLTVRDGIVSITDPNDNTVFIDPNRIAHTGGRQIDIERDTQDRISLIRDPMGHTVQYHYDFRGDLVGVIDQLGRLTEYRYLTDPAHHLDAIIDPSGTRVAALDYTPEGRLRETCDAERACATVSYDLAARSQTNRDATGRPVAYVYDARGNVLTETDALGNRITRTYDDRDNLRTEEEPTGGLTIHSYDANSNRTATTEPHLATEDPANFTTRWTYDAANHRTSMALPSGGTLRWEYDLRGNQTVVRDDVGDPVRSRAYGTRGEVLTETTRFGTTIFEYDGRNQPVRIIDADGSTATLRYDDSERLVGRTERGVTMSIAYDAMGRETSRDYGNGVRVAYRYDRPFAEWTTAEGPTIGRIERRFTAAGRLAGTTSALGATTSTRYDPAGRVVEEIGEDGTRTVYGHDAAGRLTTITNATTGATSTRVLDDAGRVLEDRDALGHTTRQTYLPGGRLETMTNSRGYTTRFATTPTSSTIRDPLGRETTVILSALGLPIEVVSPSGERQVTGYAGRSLLDESNRFPTDITDGSGRTRRYGYDARDGLVSATDLGGINTWRYEYAPAPGGALEIRSGPGATAKLVDPDGRPSAYGFDLDAETSVYTGTTALGAASEGVTGGFGHRLSAVTSPRGDRTEHVHGDLGRVSEIRYPDGGRRSITFDAAGNVDRVTLPNGVVLDHDFDVEGRELRRTSSIGEHRSATYDAAGRVLTQTDPTGTTAYTYDAHGALASLTQPSGASVEYARDVLGRVNRVTVRPSASGPSYVTEYEHDENGNITLVRDPVGGITRMEYDEADRLTRRELPNGVVTTQTYDLDDRPLSVVHRNGTGTVLASVVYDRLPGGAPRRITREDGSYVDITYDAVFHLESERYFDAAGALEDETRYEYDADGNRTARITPTDREDYLYDPGSRLREVRHTDGTIDRYTSDDAGRVTRIEREGSVVGFDYDSNDLLTRVRRDGAEIAQYAYDAATRRIAVGDTAANRAVLTAPSLGAGFESPHAITDTSTGDTVVLVYAGEHASMRIGPDGATYYMHDPMGSVLGLAGSTGAPLGTVAYDAFGQERRSTIPDSAPLGGDARFQGMWLDTASAAYFVRARHYDQATGRFFSRDPLSIEPLAPDRISSHPFSRSNPAVFRDPSGQLNLIEQMQVVFIRFQSWFYFSPTLAATLLRSLSADPGDLTSGEALGRLPRSLGAAGIRINLKSWIGQSSFAVRVAQGLGEAAQVDVDNLLAQLSAGNLSPGIGTRPLSKGYLELRGANAGRVLVRRVGTAQFDIIGKFQAHVRAAAANNRLIKRLINDYAELTGYPRID